MDKPSSGIKVMTSTVCGIDHLCRTAGGLTRRPDHDLFFCSITCRWELVNIELYVGKTLNIAPPRESQPNLPLAGRQSVTIGTFDSFKIIRMDGNPVALEC